MRTEKEATVPSKRFDPKTFYDPDRHYVKVQVAGPDWNVDDLSALMNEYDPRTGELAYRMDADGSQPGGSLITGKVNAVLISCTKEYAAFRNSQVTGASRARALAIPPTGDSHEFDATELARDMIDAGSAPVEYEKAIKVAGANAARHAAEKEAFLAAQNPA